MNSVTGGLAHLQLGRAYALAGDSASRMHMGRTGSSLGFLWFPVAGFAFLGTGFSVGLSRRRKAFMFVMGAVLCSALVVQVACGGAGNGGPKSTAYIVTVTGTSGATQHSTTIALAVQ